VSFAEAGRKSVRRVSVAFACSALALLAAQLAAPPAALAGETGRLPKFTGTFFDTTFDLGFDASGIAHTPAAAKAFILALDPLQQTKIVSACGYFLRYPAQMHSPETRAFCENVYS
jgi:hypothetical protein